MSVARAGEVVEALQRTPMSYEDYQTLPEHPRAEWVDGIVVMSPQTPSYAHQQASRRLANLLEVALPSLAAVLAIDIRLPRNRERIPDVVVVRDEPTSLPIDAVDHPPVLVVEVLSPSTRSEDLLRKAPEYAEAGIGQYWVVDTDDRTIEVLENVDGRWELVVVIDQRHPTAEVPVGDHGTVRVDLETVLR